MTTTKSGRPRSARYPTRFRCRSIPLAPYIISTSPPLFDHEGLLHLCTSSPLPSRNLAPLSRPLSDQTNHTRFQARLALCRDALRSLFLTHGIPPQIFICSSRLLPIRVARQFIFHTLRVQGFSFPAIAYATRTYHNSVMTSLATWQPLSDLLIADNIKHRTLIPSGAPHVGT